MKFLKKAAPIIASLLGIAAVVMIFFTALVSKEDSSVAYNGWQIVFGYSEKLENYQGNKTLSTPVFNFSFMNLLPYLLVLLGVAMCVLIFFDKGNVIFFWIAVAAFALAGIFFFLTWAFTIAEPVYGLAYSEILGLPTGDYEIVKTSEELMNGMELGFAPIVSGICALVAALMSASPFFIEKFFE